MSIMGVMSTSDGLPKPFLTWNFMGQAFFPPTQQMPQQFNVRIESYLKDQRSVYIENVGIWKGQIQYQNLDIIGRNTLAAAEFVSSNLRQFLNQFDKKESDPT